MLKQEIKPAGGWPLMKITLSEESAGITGLNHS
jgi:hypothetical protein